MLIKGPLGREAEKSNILDLNMLKALFSKAFKQRFPKNNSLGIPKKRIICRLKHFFISHGLNKTVCPLTWHRDPNDNREQ
jgi:hypothetical protein